MGWGRAGEDIFCGSCFIGEGMGGDGRVEKEVRREDFGFGGVYLW